MLANSMILLAAWAVTSVVGGMIVGKVCALNDHPDRPFAGSLGGETESRTARGRKRMLRRR
jgi:hypothetical protein